MPASNTALAVMALLFNAVAWGLSWWPFRQFEAVGLHPLWTTAALFSLAVLVIALARPPALREMVGTPALWALLLASGATNTFFNWGVTLGDVVRVVLLFYLMPLWAVLLAWGLLGERLTGLALLRMALALVGAAIVLMPEGGGIPLPSDLADWLGLAGGIGFALTNVLLRREGHRGAPAVALALFGGGVLVSGMAAAVMAGSGLIGWPGLPGAVWLLPLLALALLFFTANLSLQFGAARLPVNVTAVVMLVEVPVAAGSALWLGGGQLDTRAALGGACILLAALLAATIGGPTTKPDPPP